MSYVKAMLKRDKGMRLTVGCRARTKPDSSWRRDHGMVDLLLTKREGDDFAAIVLSEGTGELKHDIALVDNEIAWLTEDELELVNMDFATNMRFIDWYQNIKDDVCGDCCKTLRDEEGICPDPDCPGNNMEDYDDDDE